LSTGVNPKKGHPQVQDALYSHTDTGHAESRHSCESRNPGKHWIPPYQVRGRLSQARNDKLHRTYVVTYENLLPISRRGLPISSGSHPGSLPAKQSPSDKV